MGDESPSRPETAGYRHKSYANLSTALCAAPRSPPVLRRHTGNSEPILRHSAAKFKLLLGHAVLLHIYTAMYGGRMLNAAPEPVLPIVIACVCAPAAAIATE